MGKPAERRGAITGAVMLLALAIAPGARAQAMSAEAALARLFEAPRIEESWFAPSFLAAVPAGQVASIVEGLARDHGRLRGITGTGDRLSVELERAEVPTRITLDGEGRITGLLFEPHIATAGDLAAHVAAIAALPGETSVLVASAGETRAAHRPEAAMAVGSAAKLAILKAVADAVDGRQLAWDRVVTLDPAWRSLPTGILQDWPAGTPVTVATLANLAISRSDNTAADALLHLAGREAVEAVSPRNAPFLTTREFFVLKARANADLRRTWSAGDGAARRALLEPLSHRPAPRPGDLEAAPTLEVEWHLSAAEICRLLDDTADLPAFRINPGVADREAWASVAYKGGSEAGVLNLSTRLVGADGRAHCVVATWNDGATMDHEHMMAPYRAILRSLRISGAAPP